MSEGSVHQFPDRMARQWAAFAGELQRDLVRVGSPPDEVQHVLETLKPIYLEYARPPAQTSVPYGSDEVMRFWNDYVSRLTSGLLLELAGRELALYRAAMSGPTPTSGAKIRALWRPDEAPPSE